MIRRSTAARQGDYSATSPAGALPSPAGTEVRNIDIERQGSALRNPLLRDIPPSSTAISSSEGLLGSTWVDLWLSGRREAWRVVFGEGPTTSPVVGAWCPRTAGREWLPGGVLCRQRSTGPQPRNYHFRGHGASARTNDIKEKTAGQRRATRLLHRRAGKPGALHEPGEALLHGLTAGGVHATRGAEDLVEADARYTSEDQRPMS